MNNWYNKEDPFNAHLTLLLLEQKNMLMANVTPVNESVS